MSVLYETKSTWGGGMPVSSLLRPASSLDRIMERSRDTARHRDATVRAGYPARSVASAVAIAGTPGQFQSDPHEDAGREGLYRSGLKRTFDLALLVLSSPFVVPVIMLLALLVVLMDGGKPFYTQERVGQNGRIYRIWKLRSMVRDADARLSEYLDANPELRDEWETKQKLIGDPRITKLGRFLRKSSMDELPQLLNVLRGEMSLVGPRPMMPSQQSMYQGQAYYALRPGITGLWQVSDRNDSSFCDRARFDNVYNRSLSLKTDVAILAATVRVVLRGTGH